MGDGIERTNEPGNFEVTLEDNQEVGVVNARGELDLRNAQELQATIDEAITQREEAGGVVADLTLVEFIESVTLGVLVEQRDDLRNIGKELVLVIQGGKDPREHPVGRLLHLTGQAGEFSIYDDLALAVQSISPGD
jgi:anti-anti-sigma factor